VPDLVAKTRQAARFGYQRTGRSGGAAAFGRSCNLKSLPPGSVYSEPGGINDFARTDGEPVLVEISGFGPTDTRHFDPADTPKTPGGR
jgi:hypothetical protein